MNESGEFQAPAAGSYWIDIWGVGFPKAGLDVSKKM